MVCEMSIPETTDNSECSDGKEVKVAMQQTANDVDEMKRLSSHNLISADYGALPITFREPIAREHSQMALPTGPLDEPQHRMWYSSQENSNLVFSRQHLSGVEVNRIASLDPRKTFVPSSFQLDSL